MRLQSGKAGTICLVFFLSQVLSRQPQIEGFRYERVAMPGGPGPNRLEIDVPLLAAASPFQQLTSQTTADSQEKMIIARGGLSDLRIYDSANREVPYLLVAPQTREPRWSEGHVLPVAATNKTSGFETDLGRPLPVDALRLSGIPAPFLKRVRLEGSGDRSHWTVLVQEGTLFDLSAEKLKRLELDFEPGECRYLRITWDDSASARLPLPASVSARLASPGTLPPPLRVPLQFERRASEPGVSRYQLRLPGARLPITAIELIAAGANVLRKARVTEGRISQGEVAPETLGFATLWHSVHATTAAAELRIPITAPQEAQLELTITDGDNPPLDFTGMTAVFAYLPWIYFESRGKEPLTARFGRPDLAAPQYDLEAMRDAISEVRTAKASWGDLREMKPVVESQVSSTIPLAGAPIDVSSFRFSRKIPRSKSGLNALLLDAEVLAHTNLSDLRIVGADGRQIPYLLERQEEPVPVNLPALEKIPRPAAGNESATGSPSYYRLRLPYANLPAARLVLTTSARVFRRDVRILIEKNPADERQESWTEGVAEATWSHANPETPAPPLILQIPSLQTAEARLVVEEGDNSALPIESARLLLPSYRLRFFRETDADLTLYYGRSDLSAPRYDLALIAPRLTGEAAEEISFSPENSESAQTEAQALQTKFFWIILAAAAIALFALIARLLKKGAASSS